MQETVKDNPDHAKRRADGGGELPTALWARRPVHPGGRSPGQTTVADSPGCDHDR
jgi:hypothetical protein